MFFQLISIDDGFCSLMNLETCETKDDLKAPEGELGQQIKDALEKADAEGGDGSVLVSTTKKEPGIRSNFCLFWKNFFRGFSVVFNHYWVAE